MSRRFVVLSALAVAGASAVASVGVMATAPAAHGAGDVCVSYSGVNYAQFGTASCSSTPGGNVAVGLGSASQAISGPGTNNTVTAVSGSNLPTNAVGFGNNNEVSVVTHKLPITLVADTDNNTVNGADCVIEVNGTPFIIC